MPKPSDFTRQIFQRLPLPFRVLYRHFLLRIVDFEALSVQADIVGFLGQFAGVLIMVSLVHALLAWIYTIFPPQEQPAFAWSMEQYLVATTMLTVGLFAVLAWDAAFPDRRDIFVLAPLPIGAHTLLLAKISASAALLGGAVLALNIASGLAWPVVLAEHGVFRCLAAYWIATFAAAIFVYSSVLTWQGILALVFPRKLFLRISAFLQMMAFGVFLSVYFLEPSLSMPSAMAAAENHRLVACSPTYWFFAMFQELNGSLAPDLTWLAARAWIGFGIAVIGATVSLLLCYVRTMRKIVEEPDLVPAAHSRLTAMRFGSGPQKALLLFCVRSLMRSRQHRVIFAFYLGAGFAIALLFLRSSWPQRLTRGPLTSGIIVATLVMMTFAVVGLRSTFALPVSLTANWVLRTTQLSPPEKYLAATRRALLLLAAAPVWLIAASFCLCFVDLQQALPHLVVLGLFGSILADLNLLSFHKVPFTCSYLPGKSNIQFGFWAFLLLFVPLTMLAAHYELEAISRPWKSVGMIVALSAMVYGARALNRFRARAAVLSFEELPEEVILGLGLT